jgi:phosphatidylglycerol:prolipoprotein diacylglycerol transferase
MLPFFKTVITMGQSLSLIMVAAGGFLIWRALKTPVPETESAPDTAELDG